jgi:hypothetical protein
LPIAVAVFATFIVNLLGDGGTPAIVRLMSAPNASALVKSIGRIRGPDNFVRRTLKRGAGRSGNAQETIRYGLVFIAHSKHISDVEELFQSLQQISLIAATSAFS